MKRTHGDKPIKPSKKYEIVEETPTTSKLIIHDVTPEDELPVHIKVKNSLGETDTTVQLKVLGMYRIYLFKLNLQYLFFHRNTTY